MKPPGWIVFTCSVVLFIFILSRLAYWLDRWLPANTVGELAIMAVAGFLASLAYTLLMLYLGIW